MDSVCALCRNGDQWLANATLVPDSQGMGRVPGRPNQIHSAGRIFSAFTPQHEKIFGYHRRSTTRPDTETRR
jgi:hypothetical protein